jgi:hypothetical protein
VCGSNARESSSCATRMSDHIFGTVTLESLRDSRCFLGIRQQVQYEGASAAAAYFYIISYPSS